MIAEVVSIGTELLLGQIVDTDSVYLARQLSSLGVNVYYRTTVGDNFERAKATLKQALDRADIVFTIGGLGPTIDDLTREAIAAACDTPLSRDPAVEAHLRDWCAARGHVPADSVFRQADVPAGGAPLPNANGTAPGLWVEAGGKLVVALPGPPNEFEPMVEDQILPRLRARIGAAQAVIVSRTLRVAGMGESDAEAKLRDLIEGAHPTVAPYAKLAEVHFRVTARAATEADARAAIDPTVAEIRRRLGDAVYGEDATTLEAAVVALLTQKAKTVATAESCTGGLLAGRITEVPGSSAVFETGVVTYANETKIRLLQIPRALIGAAGAVSPEVGQAMASRVRELADADYGIGITGVAGPGGGSAEKPVGLVYIGFATRQGVSVTRHLFGGQRATIRFRATQWALDRLRRELLSAP